MAFRGTVKNGKVVLVNPKALPEGAEVEVRPVKRRPKAPKAKKTAKTKKNPPRSLADRLRSVIGKATGLPPDMSINHDHYLYGLPKRQ